MVKKKTKKNTNKNLVFYGFGVVFVLIVVALIIGTVGNSTNSTGAAIQVKSYGVSNELISNQKGKIQTLIEFTKPELKELSTVSGREKKVPEIIKQIDFKTLVLAIYEKDPWATISAGSLNAVGEGIMKETNNFKKNMKCFKEIGTNYRRLPNLKMVMTSELKYHGCRNKKDWHYGYLEHIFYRDGKILCRQNNDPLFAVDDLNGDVTTDVTNC